MRLDRVLRNLAESLEVRERDHRQRFVLGRDQHRKHGGVRTNEPEKLHEHQTDRKRRIRQPRNRIFDSLRRQIDGQ